MSLHDSFLYRAVYGRLPVWAQNAVVSAAGTPRWLAESSPRFRRMVSDLLEAERLPAGRIAPLRRAGLVEVLLAARTTRHYRDLLPAERLIESDPEGVLASVPPLSKDEVRADPCAFVSAVPRGRTTWHGTSGTTGTPLRVLWDRPSAEMERALIRRHRIRAGCEMGRTWRGMLGGHPIVPLEVSSPPYWRINLPARQAYLSTYHLSPANADAYADFIERRGITHLEGYPSVLYSLARALGSAGRRLGLEGCFFGAEPMLDFREEEISRVFGCPVWDYYGLTERVVSASQFECRNGLHVNWENCFAEILRRDGTPAGRGEFGELAGTSLSNLAFPLLRYRTGDMTRMMEDPCPCGRESPRIERIDTKREDLLVMPDGSLLSASNLTYPFKGVGNIEASQIRQTSSGLLVVLVVPGEGFTEGDAGKLLEGIRKLLPPGVSVELRTVPGIPPGPSGKFAFCVSEVGRGSVSGSPGDPSSPSGGDAV